MFHIVLVQPQIPPNTGNVIRLAANTGCTLHLIEPLGFRMEDRLLKRAGLDYHEYAAVHRHRSWQQWLDESQPDPTRCWLFSRHGSGDFGHVAWRAGDWLLFGREDTGLPDALRARFPAAHCLRLPMRPGQRSLNLSNAVAVAVFEAWRCLGYAGGV